MTMTIADYKNLIAVAQGDDQVQAEIALTDILFDIMENHMNKHLHRYYGKATTGGMDDDDIRQIFLIHVSQAVEKVDITIGNPLIFILQKGKWAVVDALRKRYRQTIRQYCHDCHKESRVFELNKVPVCAICNSPFVERVMVDIADDGEQLQVIESENLLIDEAIASSMIIEEFRTMLSGKTLEVFELIIDQGYDRSSCTNYIKEVAGVMGVTTTNINTRLRRIKQAWVEFQEQIEQFEHELINGGASNE